MAIPCPVCADAARSAIDAELARGVNMAELGRKHGYSRATMFRHRKAHLPESLRNATEADQGERTARIRRDLEDMVAGLKARLREAGEHLGDKDRRGILDITDRLIKAMELLAKVEGAIQTGAQVTVNVATQILQRIGAESEEQAAAAIAASREAAALDEGRRLELYEAALLRAYRARPELAGRSPLLAIMAKALPEAELSE